MNRKKENKIAPELPRVIRREDYYNLKEAEEFLLKNVKRKESAMIKTFEQVEQVLFKKYAKRKSIGYND